MTSILLFLSRSITFNITFSPKLSFTFTIPGAIGGTLMFNPSTLVVRISSSFCGLSNELQSSSCDTASGIKHHIKGVKKKKLYSFGYVLINLASAADVVVLIKRERQKEKL